LATPRGLALKFHLPDGTDTDLVTHSFNGFPAATADEFRRFLIALGTSGPNVPAPTPADKYLAAHPIAKTFLESQPGPPVGYGTLAYFGVNAFEFTNAAGEVRYARYRIEPLDGEHFLTKAQVAAASPTYLDEQLRKQLPSQPLRFKFIAQVAAPGDKLDDPSVAWPESRQRIELGTLELTRVVTNSDAAQEQLLFMPLALPDGIRAADPMLKARNDAYPISYSRRHR
jgi:catalase